MPSLEVRQCVVPRNIHTSPMEGTPSPHQVLLKFQLNFIHYFKFFGLTDPPPPKKLQSLLWEQYGYSVELTVSSFFGNSLVQVIRYRGLMLVRLTSALSNPGLLYHFPMLVKAVKVQSKCLSSFVFS